MGQPRAILFDAVGTLMRPEPTVSRAYTAVALRHGVRMDPVEVERRFRRAFARQDTIDATERDNRTDQQREAERWRGIVKANGQQFVFFGSSWNRVGDLCG